MAMAGICLVTNALAYDANSKISDIESRLIDKYVINLPEV